MRAGLALRGYLSYFLTVRPPESRTWPAGTRRLVERIYVGSESGGVISRVVQASELPSLSLPICTVGATAAPAWAVIRGTKMGDVHFASFVEITMMLNKLKSYMLWKYLMIPIISNEESPFRSRQQRATLNNAGSTEGHRFPSGCHVSYIVSDDGISNHIYTGRRVVVTPTLSGASLRG